MAKERQILKYERTRYDSQAADYVATFTAKPMVERYQAHVMGGSVEGELFGGNRSTNKIGPDDIRMIIEALEQCDWVKWAKQRMRRAASSGNIARDIDGDGLPDVPAQDDPREHFRRTRQAQPASVADRLQLGPPQFPGDVSQRQRERYAKPAPARPLPAARSLPTARAEEPERERFQRLKAQLKKVPREHFAHRAGLHYELEGCDERYRAARAPVAKRVADYALLHGLDYDTARQQLGVDVPLPLVPSGPV